ncbi:hypothetical protein PAEPH01_1237 [Pancytospora epiphaga]|nr:hypothetical protein PAEPH01_1237 [Pancytospora epiphaga]
MILKYKLIKTIIVVSMLGLQVGCSTAPVLPRKTETSNESLSCSTSTLKNTDESINPEVATPSKLNKPLAPVVLHCKACELLLESSKPVVTPSEVNKSIITPSKSNESVVTPSKLNKPLAPIAPHCKACELLLESSKPVVTPSEVNKSIITPNESNESVVAPSKLNKPLAPVVPHCKACELLLESNKASKDIKTNESVVAISKANGPAIANFSDKPSTVASTLKDAGFKVYSLDVSGVDNVGPINDSVFAVLIGHASKLLKKYVFIVETALMNVIREAESIHPESNDLESKVRLFDAQTIMSRLHGRIIEAKKYVYVDNEEPKIEKTVKNDCLLWKVLFDTVGEIRKLIDKAKKKAKGANIIIEPFEKNEKIKKSFLVIARLLVSIDQAGFALVELHREYLTRCDGYDRFVVDPPYVPCHPSSTDEITGDENFSTEESDKIKSRYVVAMSRFRGLAAHDKLKHEGMPSFLPGCDVGEGISLFTYEAVNDNFLNLYCEREENDGIFNRCLVGTESSEYFSYCKERLKGVLSALKLIKKEMDNMIAN